VGSLGALSGLSVMVHMSSGGDWSGSSRIPVPVSIFSDYREEYCRTCFVAAVSQVGVHTPWLSLGRGNGNAMLLSIVKQVLPALEAITELGQPPWRDDLNGRLEGVESELEADLVVALASAAVGDELAAFLLCDADLCASNDWASQAGSEEVSAFVRGIALDSAEAELLNELLLEVEDDHLQRTDLERLLLDLIPWLLLANVGEEAHDLISLL
jgi:hypothetical protein